MKYKYGKKSRTISRKIALSLATVVCTAALLGGGLYHRNDNVAPYKQTLLSSESDQLSRPETEFTIISKSPEPQSVLSGEQTMLARVEGMNVDTYTMQWSIKDGEWHDMISDYAQDIKTATVNVDELETNEDVEHTIAYRAHDTKGEVIAELAYSVSIDKADQDAQKNTVDLSTATRNTVNPPVPPVRSFENVFAGRTLFVESSTNAAREADSLEASGDARAPLIRKLSQMPTAKWVGAWTSNVQSSVHSYVSAAQAQGSVAMVVLYGIPDISCSGTGGISSADAYKSWVSMISAGIAGRDVMVILEPDALAMLGSGTCSGPSFETVRTGLLLHAVNTLQTDSTKVYLDGGHSSWVSADETARRLRLSGVDRASGFALNVSNFGTTASNVTFGTSVSQLVGGKHFIIDTARNGNGPHPSGEWCNAPGRAVGESPTLTTNNSLVDAYAWVKVPGESDGTCNGGPEAGKYWVDYAHELARNAGW